MLTDRRDMTQSVLDMTKHDINMYVMHILRAFETLDIVCLSSVSRSIKSVYYTSEVYPFILCIFVLNVCYVVLFCKTQHIPAVLFLLYVLLFLVFCIFLFTVSMVHKYYKQ